MGIRELRLKLILSLIPMQDRWAVVSNHGFYQIIRLSSQKEQKFPSEKT